MKKLGRIFLVGLFVCLVVLGLPRLIVATDPVPDALPLANASSPLHTAIAAVLPQETDSQAGMARTAPSLRKQLSEAQCLQTVSSHVVHTSCPADANGCPVISQVYIRTVYQAFPPESLYG